MFTRRAFRHASINTSRVRPTAFSRLPPLAFAKYSTMAPAETQGYKFNHTMIRVKDPKASLKFYCDILGMDLIQEQPMTDFTLYFLGYGGGASEGSSIEEKRQRRLNREGILELTHNHGTESDPNFQGYASGNSDPGRGFGHIAISVPNIQECCARLESLGVPFKKRLTDGRMKNIAFALDPDGYWVEIVPQSLAEHPNKPE